MPLLTDETLAEKAEQRAAFRLTNVSSKLSQGEAGRLDALARKRGQQRGEFIRSLILAELIRDNGLPAASAELSLKPIANGQKLTPEVFDGIMAEVKRRKRTVAIEAQQDLERA
jgi:hypothetical protein